MCFEMSFRGVKEEMELCERDDRFFLYVTVEKGPMSEGGFS